MQLAHGAVVGGKYRLERPLARGGMGSVWVASHVQLGSPLAIKFLDPGFAVSAAHRARFEREARSAANVKSPHVVNVQDYGFEGDMPYLVMELLEGEDLSTRLRRVGRMSLHDTARVLVQVGKALRKAHEAGIVHRDLKPANLYIARIDDDEVVKILDFGIAKDSHSPLGDATRTGEVLGSPHYMSPEQVRAEKDIDYRTDLWSVGVLLFRMLVGSLPFPGDQLGPVLVKILHDPIPVPTQSAPALPPSIDAFFARALHRDKAQRFQSIGEMVEAFQLAAGGKEAFPSISMSLGTGLHPALSTGGAEAAMAPLIEATPRPAAAFADAPPAYGGSARPPAPAPAPLAGGGIQAAIAGPYAGPLVPPSAEAGFQGVSSGPYGAPIAAPITGPVGVTNGGLASTGSLKPRGPSVAVGALVVGLAVGAVCGLAFLLLRSPSTEPALGAAIAADVSASAAVTAPPPPPTVAPASSGAASAEPAPPTVVPASSGAASAEPAPSSSSSVSAAPRPGPRPRSTALPPPTREKWF
jgi:hypothetical protein